MTNSEQQSAAVTASGVIAILGSVFTATGILFALAGMFIASSMPNAPDMLPRVRMIAAAAMFAFLAVAIFGIVCGVGLIRFRNWARIATLVWSGIAAPICLVAMAAMIFVPLPPTPNSPAAMMTLVHVMIVAFYAAPLAIAVWWLILFTRSRIVAQFRSGAPPLAAGSPGDPFTALPSPATALDSSNDLSAIPSAAPATTYTAVATPTRPSIPLPIIVLSCFFLVGAASIFFVFFIHVPAMVFGHAYTGLTGSVIYASWCVLYAIAGAGMLRRITWTYSVAIGVQILTIVSSIMTLLSPNFDSIMRRAMTNMNLPTPEVYSAPSMDYLRGFSLISLIFPLAILGLLAYCRPRFLAACAQPLPNPGTSPAIEPTI